MLEVGEMPWLCESRRTHLKRGSSFIKFFCKLLQADICSLVKLNLSQWTVTLISGSLTLLRVFLSTHSYSEIIKTNKQKHQRLLSSAVRFIAMAGAGRCGAVGTGVWTEVGLRVYWLRASCSVPWAGWKRVLHRLQEWSTFDGSVELLAWILMSVATCSTWLFRGALPHCYSTHSSLTGKSFFRLAQWLVGFI